jgi:uncharacterized repeat protein (TIGR01451 family)
MTYFVRRSAVLTVAARILSRAFVITMMLIAGNIAAMAQQSSSQFATGLTTPAGGLVLSGTAINPATGNPFRHLWTADAVNGFCRLDPDVDSAAAHAINPATCLSTVAGGAFNAAQMTLDPATNTIYAVDGGNKAGIFVLHVLADGDTGHGLMDQVNTSVLAPTCGIAVNQPNATSLGPDGNLYVGFRRSGNIMRINSPLTNPLPCANVQATVIVTGDRLTSQMAWVGHGLFINGTRLPFELDQADQCLTPQNGNAVCAAGLSVVDLIAAVPTVLVSDQTSGLNGDDVYFGGLSNVSAELGITQNAVGQLNFVAPQPFATDAFFANIGALALDSSDPTSNVLYVADDPSPGAVVPTGRWWQVLSAPPVPAPPSAPVNVVATAGNASAILSWTAPANHQPVTSYTVHNSLASNGVLVADMTITAVPGTTRVPTSSTVTGLTNGVTYQFEVQATNAQGSSPFSAPSNSVTPQAPTAPGMPTNVSAIAGDTSATVSWTAPASDGGSPITSYTVTAFTGGAPAVVTTTQGGSPATVFPLTNGVLYTFSVHATNAIGNGPESLQSAAVTPGGAPDLAISMTGQASVIAGANVAYTVVVTNLGPGTAPAVTMVDSISGATVSSVTTTQGTCTTVGGTTINCNLGAVPNGASVTITVTVKPSAETVNQASVQSNGDPNFANNTASVTTAFIPLNQTTDVQVIGSAQNGGPAVTASDTITWQIKNNQPLVANAVHFSSQLPKGMVFQSAVSTLGATCTQPVGLDNTTFTCDLATLPGGQAMIVTVTVTFNATGNLQTSGTATFNGTDNNPANNSASITVGVK